MELRLDYRPGLFDEESARGLLDRLVSVLAQFTADPRQRTGTVELLSAAERRLVVREWNDTRRAVPGGAARGAGSRRRRRGRRERWRWWGGAVSWTYAELNARANGVAYGLIERGVGPESLVGVRLERSAALVPVLLGVLKAGAAYAPLDSCPAGGAAGGDRG
ncbi:Non-ribosomal peptide synthetase OS=Streptomyces fumanus OX=67302 GN=GCM10018772_70860 PE=4 SV=1 [Streptomyces fumanus]